MPLNFFIFIKDYFIYNDYHNWLELKTYIRIERRHRLNVHYLSYRNLLLMMATGASRCLCHAATPRGVSANHQPSRLYVFCVMESAPSTTATSRVSNNYGRSQRYSSLEGCCDRISDLPILGFRIHVAVAILFRMHQFAINSNFKKSCVTRSGFLRHHKLLPVKLRRKFTYQSCELLVVASCSTIDGVYFYLLHAGK